MASNGGACNKANQRQHSNNEAYYKRQEIVTARNKKRHIALEAAKHLRHMRKIGAST